MCVVFHDKVYLNQPALITRGSFLLKGTLDGMSCWLYGIRLVYLDRVSWALQGLLGASITGVTIMAYAFLDYFVYYTVVPMICRSVIEAYLFMELYTYIS